MSTVSIKYLDVVSAKMVRPTGVLLVEGPLRREWQIHVGIR